MLFPLVCTVWNVFFTKTAPPPRDMDTEKMFQVLFFFTSNVLHQSLMKNLAQYHLGNFSIFPKGGWSSTTEVPDLSDKSSVDQDVVRTYAYV